MTEAHALYRNLGSAAAPPPAAPGDAKRDQAILDELPQVYFIASRILERLPAGVELEDLVHAGVIGLLEAYKHYDSARNAQFKTFARFRIRGAILDSLRSLDWGSRGMRRKAREIKDAAQRLELALGRQPEKEEVAREMGFSLEELDTAMRSIDSLQIVGREGFAGAESSDAEDLIETAPSREESPFDLCLKAEQKQQLAEAVAALGEREQLVLSLYYKEELTMKEVAEVVGIAVSRVSQLHHAAIGKLRAALGVTAVGVN